MRLAVLILAVLAAPDALAERAATRFDDERLFTTAEQRKYLDALRDGAPLPNRAADARRQAGVPSSKSSPPKKAPSVALQGFLRRSDGQSAVWANGENTLRDSRLSGDIRIDGDIVGDTVVITLPNGGRVRLAPGQVWDSGRIFEQHQR